jgi:hypothetical protein
VWRARCCGPATMSCRDSTGTSVGGMELQHTEGKAGQHKEASENRRHAGNEWPVG